MVQPFPDLRLQTAPGLYKINNTDEFSLLLDSRNIHWVMQKLHVVFQGRITSYSSFKPVVPAQSSSAGSWVLFCSLGIPVPSTHRCTWCALLEWEQEVPFRGSHKAWAAIQMRRELLGMDPSLKFVAQPVFFPPWECICAEAQTIVVRWFLNQPKFKIVDRRDRGGTMQWSVKNKWKKKKVNKSLCYQRSPGINVC